MTHQALSKMCNFYLTFNVTAFKYCSYILYNYSKQCTTSVQTALKEYCHYRIRPDNNKKKNYKKYEMYFVEHRAGVE